MHALLLQRGDAQREQTPERSGYIGSNCEPYLDSKTVPRNSGTAGKLGTIYAATESDFLSASSFTASL